MIINKSLVEKSMYFYILTLFTLKSYLLVYNEVVASMYEV
jgi:hypothetical protein